MKMMMVVTILMTTSLKVMIMLVVKLTVMMKILERHPARALDNHAADDDDG